MTEGEADARIAVIGMAGRFPGATNLDELWQMLSEGREAKEELPEQVLRSAGATDALLRDPNFVRSCMPIADFDCFDAEFFACSPQQAADIDPQHRLFLECSWTAFEHSGYDIGAYAGPVGVFAGAGTSSYLLIHLMNQGPFEAMRHVIDADKDLMCPRVSYKLGLTGPSMGIQTGCSSSLVAVHVAVQSLLNFESDMAVAGGSSLRIPHRSGYLYAEGEIFSPDGHCRAYDSRARGTAPSSGVAAVVLKRYADAVADGDHIHAVIRGSAVNNDGAHKAGFAAPSPQAQANLIATALGLAGLSASDIDYVEGHGSGTVLGDAIELTALTRIFSDAGCPRKSCAIGSIKTNLGHLDASAGVTGLIKVALCMQHGIMVPSLHCDVVNAVIATEDTPLFVNSQLREWKSRPGEPRRAAISSFGAGGTNAHMIVEEAPPSRSAADVRADELFVFSAATPGARATTLLNFADHVEREQIIDLHDAAFTMQVGRRALTHRAFVVAASREVLVRALRDQGGNSLHAGEARFGDRSACFVLPGRIRGPVPDLSDLCGGEPSFKHDVATCGGLLLKHCGAEQEQEVSLFAQHWCVARLWQRWGMRPALLIGEGVGEYVCVCIAGVLSLEDSVRLLAARLRLRRRCALEAIDLSTASGAQREILLAEFSSVIGGLNFGAANIPMIAMGGGRFSADIANEETSYWRLVQDIPKSLSPAVESVLNDRRNLLIEIGAGDSQIASRIAQDDRDDQLVVIASGSRPPRWDRRTLLTTAGRYWLLGGLLEGRGENGELRGRRVPLPTYPFERTRHWIEPKQPAREQAASPDAVVAATAISPVAARHRLETEVSSIWLDILGISRIEAADTFFGLGGDSRGALRVTARIEEVAGVRLPLQTFVDPDLTVSKLAGVLLAHMDGAPQTAPIAAH